MISSEKSAAKKNRFGSIVLESENSIRLLRESLAAGCTPKTVFEELEALDLSTPVPNPEPKKCG